ncbi:MAG: DUF4097 family beta strand repeat protein [Spirochaetaceae bacterium]|nr:DUF4097 family beta strand repeat protein [Spirochaetaceae bacterium]
MKLKDIKLNQLVKMLALIAASSIVLLGLVVWIFDIPAYFRGEKGSYVLTDENSVSVNVNKTYEMDGISSIEADLSFSDIDVIVRDVDSVSFIYTGSVISKPEFEEPFLLFNMDGGKLSIRTTMKSGYRVANSNLVLKISLPENKLKELNLATTSGDITLLGNASENLLISTSSGDAAVNGYGGDSLKTRTSSGHQDYINLNVAMLDLSSSSGDITMDDSVSEKTVIGTSSGEITIVNFTSDENRIKTTSGKVLIDDYSGNLDFSSSSGRLNGGFLFGGYEILARTSSGDVTLTFPEDAGFQVRTETSSGDFNTDFPLTLEGDFSDDRVSGRIGDGSGLVNVHTSSGDISIKTR